MILTLLALAFAGPIDDLSSEADLLGERRAELLDAIETRGGFDTGAREVELFERALTELLIGDPAEAAMGFYVLLNMGSTDAELVMDSEWYLAESMAAMGFHELAAQRFQALADGSHPFKNQALAELIRLRADHGPAEAFREVYERGLAANRIRPTAEFSYVLGRAQYDLGNAIEARRVLSEVEAGTDYFVRARYVMAVMDLQADDLESARAGFEFLADLPTTVTAEKLATELAALAVARIHFHRKSFDDAGDWYGRVATLESVLDDSLVENIWTQVALEDWGATLLSFGYFHHLRPDHHDAGRMRVLEGHVLYKMGRHSEAEVAYERVRDLYRSIIERMNLLDMTDVTTVQLLREPDRWQPGRGLPPKWALLDFLDQEGVVEGLALQADIHWLVDELEAIEELLRAIGDALSTNGAIGRFQIYRQEADTQVDLLVQLRLRLLVAEVGGLVRAGILSRKRGDALIVELENDLHQRVATSVARSDRFTRIGELRADRRTLLAQLVVQEVEATRAQVQAVEGELVRLERDRRGPAYTQAEFEQLAALRARVTGLRAPGYDAGPADALHSRLDVELRDSLAARARVDADEAAARAPIVQILETETRQLAAFQSELVDRSADVAEVWHERAESGRTAVTTYVSDGLMQAEAGLGDVVWLALLDTRDRVESVQDEQRQAITAMEALFQMLRERGQ